MPETETQTKGGTKTKDRLPKMWVIPPAAKATEATAKSSHKPAIAIPGASATVNLILWLLGYAVSAALAAVPGASVIKAEVDLSALTELIVGTEATTPGVGPILKAITANVDTLFPDPMFRPYVMQLLTLATTLTGGT